MPGVEHGSGVNDTNAESGRCRETRGEPRIGRFDRAWNSENGRTNPARTGWQELRNLFSKLKFGQKYNTKWHLTTWTDCENEPEFDQQRLATTREGAIAVGMGSRALVDRESLTVRARCHSGRGWQPKPRGVRRSRYAMICEAGASRGAFPSGSLGTRKNEPEFDQQRLAITREGAIAVGMGSWALVDRESLTVRARCHRGRGWQPKPRGVRRSRYAMKCETGASRGAFPSGSLGTSGSIVPRTPKMDERTRRASGGKNCVTCFPN